MEQYELMSPKIDFAFKEMMQSDETRKRFLGATLNIDKNEIQETTLMETVLRKEFEEDKFGILDVRVRLENGTEIDIEMQVAAFPAWADRSLYYTAKLFTETVKQGDPYHDLKKCIGISVLDFNLWNDLSFYHSHFQLLETKRHFLYTDKMEFHVIELKKLPEEKEGIDPLYWWGRFFNAKKKEEFEMLVEKYPDLEVAYEQLQRVSADDSKRAEYLSREKAIRDYATIIEENKRKQEEAEARGEARGEAKMAALTKCLLEKSLTSELIRASEDIEYRNKLFDQYHIS